MEGRDFMRVELESDVLELLCLLRSSMYHFNSKIYTPMSLVEADIKLQRITQGREMPTPLFYTKFKNMVAVIDHFDGSIVQHPLLVKQEISDISGSPFDSIMLYMPSVLLDACQGSRDKYLAYFFLTNACKHR